MPDPVEGFANIAKNNANRLAFVQSPAKGIVEIKKLIDRRISRYKTRLERSYFIVFKQEIIQMFMRDLFERFSWRTEQRDRSIIFDLRFIILFMNRRDVSFLSNIWHC